MTRVLFDRVVVRNANGLRVEYSASEFLALPLHERIEHVLGRDIVFFLGHVPVDRAEALRSLRRP